MTAPSDKATAAPKSKPQTQAYPSWSPRFWHGMPLGVWLRELRRHRFRIHPVRLGLACTVTGCTVVNSLLRLVQRVRWGRTIAATAVVEPPIFIIGHWRSGTTFLHELLVLDERFTFPTTYECFAPNHFLMSSWIAPRLLGFLLPRRRPMDNMLAGFDRPQEDEFALANLGCPTPYLRMAFPNEPPCYLELLDMEDVPADVLAQWKRHVVWFAKALTLQKKKRLVLKSPPHTGRVGVLSELFPAARFIHMTRDPYTLFVSTRRLWSALDAAQGLQIPHHQSLDEYVLSAFERMYRGFERQRADLDPAQICDVRYEDLVRDPLGQLAGVYAQLGLGDFDRLRPALEAYLQTQKDYQPNRHEELDPALKAEIRRRWRGYAEKYGYADEAS